MIEPVPDGKGLPKRVSALKWPSQASLQRVGGTQTEKVGIVEE